MRTLILPRKGTARRPEMTPSQTDSGTQGALREPFPKSPHTSFNVSSAAVPTASATALMPLRTGVVSIAQLLAWKGVGRTFTASLCRRIRAVGLSGVSCYFFCDSQVQNTSTFSMLSRMYVNTDVGLKWTYPGAFMHM